MTNASNPRNIRKRNPRSGTTLLEMLVTLALMALIAALISPTFSFLGRLSNVENDGKEEMTQALARMSFQRVVLSMPMQISHPSMAPEEIFRGDATQLKLVAYWDSQLTTPAKFNLEFSKEAQSLALTRQFFEKEGMHQSLLRTDISDCKFGYWSKFRGWQEDWSSFELAPELVKVRCWDLLGKEVVPLVLQPGLETQSKIWALEDLVPR